MSTDIYEVQEPPWAKKPEPPPSQRRRRRHRESFDEKVNPDISSTRRRRSHNSGFRRFLHLLKKPEFSRKFWLITLGTAVLILILLIVWDRFFRYPKQKSGYTPTVYRAVVE